MFRQSSIEKEEMPSPGIVAQLITHMNNNGCGAALPARTARLLGRSRASTPEAIVKGRTPQTTPPGPPPPTDDSSTLRMDRSTHGSMQQDIVSIKAMLLKLKRVLQEPDEGLNLTRTETLNPLDIQGSPLKYGPSLHLGEEGEASPPPPPPHPLEEVADLKRQLIFLQSQLEERERMVKLLQQQMIKYSEANSPNGDHKCNGVNAEDMCNVATQTERIRPLSQGPNMLQGLNSEAHHGGLVSWNEQTTPQKLTSPQNDCNGNNHAITSTPVSRLKKPNHISSNHSPSNHINGKLNDSYSKISNRQENGAIQNGVQLKVNCRVGSRYLQAINNKNNQIDSKGDNFCQRNVRSRSLHTSRSKSIENVNKTVNGCSNGSMNGNLLTVYNDCDSKETGDTNLVQSNIYKRHHHASYNNLNNGCISDSCESDSSCHVKCQESQHNGYNNNDVNSLTDTDENSDSGYKSLPPSIHLINGNNKSVAINGNGINLQRRSNNLDFRLSTSKNAQINKC